MQIAEILNGFFGLDWWLIALQLANLLIVFAVLQKFVFSKLSNLIAERREMINNSIMKAEQAETELKNARSKANSIIISAQNDATEIIADAKKKSAEITSAEKQKTQAEIERMIKDAKNQAEAEKKEQFKSFRVQLADLVALATKKLTHNKATSAEGEKMIDEMVDQIDNQHFKNNIT